MTGAMAMPEQPGRHHRPGPPAGTAGAQLPLFVGNEIFRRSRHAPGHPLAIPRVGLVIDLCRALGWLPDRVYREAAPASPAMLERFHDRDYVAAVARVERTQRIGADDATRYNLGVNGNAVYPEIFRRPAAACGASLLAARLLTDGGRVYNPAGGTHHGLRGRASGYCIFNDPVLAILDLKAAGIAPVFYLDLDAHWGDGVQHAFADDDDVFTLSIHEAGRWPMARGGDGRREPGGLDDRAGGAALNLPLPAGAGDGDLRLLMEQVVLPWIGAVRPRAIVIQAGCDGLADDPMTKLAYSNRGLWRAVALVAGACERLLVLGGGGYNPYAVGRAWAGLWALLAGQAVPERLPAPAAAILAAVRWTHRMGRCVPERWLTTLADPSSAAAAGAEVRAIARRARWRPAL